MLKLMKYEFRKTMFSKMILVAITGIFEIVYLIGVFAKKENLLAIGMMGLVFCAMIGIFCIGIESLSIFQKDLNTKQSYMLFLTPTNSYQVLGAKVIENGISIFLAGAFFAAVAAADITVGVLYIGGVKQFLDLLEQLMISIRVDINISAQDALIVFFAGLTSWLLTIVTADLAIVLSATVFAGKRFSGFVSFVLFILFDIVIGKLLDLLPSLDNTVMTYSMYICVAFVITVIMYLITGWIMERKLSV